MTGPRGTKGIVPLIVSLYNYISIGDKGSIGAIGMILWIFKPSLFI